jgi:hypothetical protein
LAVSFFLSEEKIGLELLIHLFDPSIKRFGRLSRSHLFFCEKLMKLVNGQTAQVHEDTPIWINGMMEGWNIGLK